ncbi:hypothetical protein [Rhodoferax fermentans]|uniref:Ner winged helix-turn-helix DNA-binding domain-containing protein n=1 Tax=Rhodoferax fermentans TaxID=28066 RepID=A0A1T1AP73_RHOFE|nr:hypothetical protein [Rhodoferax fermentans]MBK1683417.1 hypothetical protein [Rhodoferax fermentans]OOV05837.1 hypothetical protein RF819_03135 [Rhodoferax fermentans]
MEPADIKAAIERAGTNQSAIARYLGVTTGHIAQVVNKKVRSARVEAELQKITGRPIHAQKAKRGRRMAVWNGQVAV